MVLARPPILAILWLALTALAMGCTKPHPAEGIRPLPLVMVGDYTAQAESLQPRLRWEGFPRPQDIKADKDGRLGDARGVTYEVRIWRADGEVFGACAATQVRFQCVFPAELVYERSGLAETFHTLESPLKPNRLYLWTVRARFDLWGQPRVTPWAVLLSTEDYPELPKRRDTTIPRFCYYSFMTPSE